MIKIIAGVYGYKENGIILPKDKDSEPFSLDPEREAELVAQGVAEYANVIIPEAELEPEPETAGAEQQPFRIAVLGAMLELGPDEHRLHEDVGRYAVEGGADALVTVGSTSDEALDALAEAMAQGGKAVAADPTMVQWAHDAEQADRMVTRLATDHEGTVVLLKGSHASGLSALAERWTQN